MSNIRCNFVGEGQTAIKDQAHRIHPMLHYPGPQLSAGALLMFGNGESDLKWNRDSEAANYFVY